MALVPFRVSGRAADQALEERLMQFGPHLVTLEQVKGYFHVFDGVSPLQLGLSALTLTSTKAVS